MTFDASFERSRPPNTAPGKDDLTTAQSIVREWAEHDMNEHYNSDCLRDEFGSEHLEARIANALATVRKEARATAFKEATGVAAAKTDKLRQTEPFGTGVISASVQILEALEVALANSEEER